MGTDKDLKADKCPTRETLIDFYEGQLLEDSLVLVGRHLEGCPICESELTEIHCRPPLSKLSSRLQVCLGPGVGYLGGIDELREIEIAARNIHLEECGDGNRKFADRIEIGWLARSLQFRFPAEVDLK